MNRSSKLAVLSTVTVLALTGCDKAAEPYRDAPRGTQNTAPADTITMPDGFSNLATKCDHGNRIYVVFKGDNLYGSVAVVANDPSCSGVAK